MRLRFTIRDLLWLAVVVALAMGWWVDHDQLTADPWSHDLTLTGDYGQEVHEDWPERPTPFLPESN